MNINLTLIAQALTFAAFIWFTVKFVWPFMLRAIEARQKIIADGLAAAERGNRSLELSARQADEVSRHARERAAEILVPGRKRAAPPGDGAEEGGEGGGAGAGAAARTSRRARSGRRREDPAARGGRARARRSARVHQAAALDGRAQHRRASLRRGGLQVGRRRRSAARLVGDACRAPAGVPQRAAKNPDRRPESAR